MLCVIRGRVSKVISNMNFTNWTFKFSEITHKKTFSRNIKNCITFSLLSFGSHFYATLVLFHKGVFHHNLENALLKCKKCENTD